MAKTICDEIFEKLKAAVEDYNKALLNRDFNAKSEAETNIRGYETEYKKAKRDAVLYQLSKESDPMMAAVLMLTYPVFRAKSVKEDGKEVGMELATQDVRVNLVKVAEYCKLPTVWQYDVEKIALLLSLRTTKLIGGTAKDLKAISKDYRMNDIARKTDLGETPDSDTQIVKLIQGVLDKILPGKGKANKYDANYLIVGSARAGQKVKTVKLVDPRTAHNLFIDVANRVVTGSKYSVDYRKVRNASENTEPAPEPQTPAAETVEVSDEHAA